MCTVGPIKYAPPNINTRYFEIKGNDAEFALLSPLRCTNILVLITINTAAVLTRGIMEYEGNVLVRMYMFEELKYTRTYVYIYTGSFSTRCFFRSYFF